MNNFMQIRNIWSLLDQYKADGFSLKCLSKVTDTSIDVIERCYNKEELNQDDVKELNTVLWFLGQLYCCDTNNKLYLHEIVLALCYYFEVSRIAVAKYLGIIEDQLSCFLDDPANYPNGYNLSIKLLHLFNTFLRDKRYSV